MDHPSGWKRRGWMRTCRVPSRPLVRHRGDRRDAAEMNRLVAAMGHGRTDFRTATARLDMEAAVAAEVRLDGLTEELREVLGVVVLRPDDRPFTDAEAEPFVETVRRARDTDTQEGAA